MTENWLDLRHTLDSQYETDIFFLTLVALPLWNETDLVTTSFNVITWYNAVYLINRDYGDSSISVDNPSNSNCHMKLLNKSINNCYNSAVVASVTRTTFETPKYPRRPRDQYAAQIVNTSELSGPHQIELKKKHSPTWWSLKQQIHVHI